MSTRLERYLTEERKKLDVEFPDDNRIWNGIQQRLYSGEHDPGRLNKRIRLLRIRNIAAAAVIIFLLGYIANDIVDQKISDRQVTLSSIDSELGRREKEYKSLINYKTEEIGHSADSDDRIIVQLLEEIKRVDLMYDQAMLDLSVLGPDERVINTIFSTYEQKIRLLELIILETNKRNDNNEKIIL